MTSIRSPTNRPCVIDAYWHHCAGRPQPLGTVPLAAAHGDHSSKHGKKAKAKQRLKHSYQKHALPHAAPLPAHGGSGNVAGAGRASVAVDPLSDQLVALAFKVTHDKRKMPVVVRSHG